MSYDLAFGRTQRDWSCGGLVNRFPGSATNQQRDLDAAIEISNVSADRLFADVRGEIQTNYEIVMKLTRAKRLPTVESKKFTSFLEGWLNFGLSKNGIFTPDDIEALTQYREANKHFTEKLAVFVHAASVPFKKPLQNLPTPSATEIPSPPAPPVSSNSWGWLLGLGLGLTGVAIVASKRP